MRDEAGAMAIMLSVHLFDGEKMARIIATNDVTVIILFDVCILGIHCTLTDSLTDADVGYR